MVYGHNSKGGKWHEICMRLSVFTVLSVCMFLAQSTMCNAVRFKHQRVLSNKMRTCICLKWAEWEHIFSPWVHPLLVAHSLTKKKEEEEKSRPCQLSSACLRGLNMSGNKFESTLCPWRLSAVTGLLPLTRAHERVRPPEIKDWRWLGVFAADSCSCLDWRGGSSHLKAAGELLTTFYFRPLPLKQCLHAPSIHRVDSLLSSTERLPVLFFLHTQSRPWPCATL